MRLIAFLLLIFISDAALETHAHAATKKTEAKKIKKKSKKKAEAPQNAVGDIKTIDLDLNDSIELDSSVEEIPDMDLESTYVPAARKRGDLKIEPEFKYVEDPDPTVSDRLEQEKEFKLQFNVGL
jgi:hypothetical protein